MDEETRRKGDGVKRRVGHQGFTNSTYRDVYQAKQGRFREEWVGFKGKKMTG